MSSIAISASPSSSTSDDEINKQLERAKAVLEISRAKMEARELAAASAAAGATGDDSSKDPKARRKGPLGTDVPFFATQEVVAKKDGKKEKVIKNKNKEGLFTTDGDLMAKLSEEEEWESRPLLEVFQNERGDAPKDSLADRDVAASIFNLRKVLQTEDFQRIFDQRNRFIGEQ
jgi:hypothetical protein